MCLRCSAQEGDKRCKGRRLISSYFLTRTVLGGTRTRRGKGQKVGKKRSRLPVGAFCKDPRILRNYALLKYLTGYGNL